MYVFVYRRQNVKKIFKYLYQYEAFFFFLEAILLTCIWSNENKPAQICMYESHDNFLYTVTWNNLSRKFVAAENVSYKD
jgi:hypothetical protein